MKSKEEQYKILKEFCKKQGCQCPNQHIVFSRWANMPTYMRHLFVLQGRDEKIEEIKLKIKWLKDKVEEAQSDYANLDNIEKDEVIKLINKAFEDKKWEG